MEVALVTGAARGIGLELCRLLLGKDHTVVACPRRTSQELEALGRDYPGRLFEVLMDVGSEDSVQQAAGKTSSHVDRIDVLFNNAGVYPEGDRIETLDIASLADAFRVNTLGPLRVTKAFLPLLRKGRGRRLIQITSLMGSNADNTSGGSYAYRISKAALNMATTNLGHELGREGFVTLAIHPGWVRTRMGGTAAPLEIRPAAEEVLRISLSATPADNGCFKGPGGGKLPY